jgi:hypothetical protein
MNGYISEKLKVGTIPYWEKADVTNGVRLKDGDFFRVRLQPLDDDNDKVSEIVTGTPYGGSEPVETPVCLECWSDTIFSSLEAQDLSGYDVYIGMSNHKEVLPL